MRGYGLNLRPVVRRNRIVARIVVDALPCHESVPGPSCGTQLYAKYARGKDSFGQGRSKRASGLLFRVFRGEKSRKSLVNGQG